MAKWIRVTEIQSTEHDELPDGVVPGTFDDWTFCGVQGVERWCRAGRAEDWHELEQECWLSSETSQAPGVWYVYNWIPTFREYYESMTNTAANISVAWQLLSILFRACDRVPVDERCAFVQEAIALMGVGGLANAAAYVNTAYYGAAGPALMRADT